MNEIHEKLEQLAFERTTPFCYGCYIKAPKGVCPKCYSDDLMRHLDDVGVEWGTSWVINHIVEQELTPVDLNEVFEESIRDCYPDEIKVGWMTVDAVDVMKTQDPVGWRCALSEYKEQEADEGNIVSFDNGVTYYWTHDLDSLVE